MRYVKIDQMFLGIAKDVTLPTEFYDYLRENLNSEYDRVEY